MAVHFDTAGDRATLSSAIAGSADFTVMGHGAVSAFAAYQVLFATMNGIGVYSQWARVTLSTTHITLSVDSGAAATQTATFEHDLAVGEWFKWAYVRDESGTRHRLYFNGDKVGAISSYDLSGTSFDTIVLGDDGTGSEGVILDNVWIYSNNLSKEKLRVRWNLLEPAVTNSLWAAWQFENDLEDWHTTNRDLTATGTLAFVNGPHLDVFPPRTDPRWQLHRFDIKARKEDRNKS